MMYEKNIIDIILLSTVTTSDAAYGYLEERKKNDNLFITK